MTAERAKSDYKQKLITAEAYMLYLLDSHRSVGWKWTIEPKEFCKTWEIPRSTFYRAISSLKSKGKLNWEVQGKITLWRGSDIGIEDSLTNGIDNLTNETCSLTNGIDNLTNETCSLTNGIDNLTNETAVLLMGKQGTQSLVQQEFENLTDIKQRETDSTESVSLPLTHNQEPPAIAPFGGASPATALNEEEVPRDAEVPQVKLTNDELKTHLDAAVKGVMPSDDVIGQLRDSDYWVCFRRAAEVHNWDLGQLFQSDVPAHLKEHMRSLAEKFKRRRF
ncbi:hypothetical protein [Tolypothrix sp. NIES-4075]|uniref:hypothetical protein n=1 Tax=Tolypothrix sp. NIES-4075 TaxID=2005459 RepID=UPI001F27C446|nr:hypothetical protein [Tolypothrix sp. NIES-4075]